jgi:hypothetical protein
MEENLLASRRWCAKLTSLRTFTKNTFFLSMTIPLLIWLGKAVEAKAAPKFVKKK